MSRIDKEAVRAAASGQWGYVIEHLCGVDTSGWRHAGPCPKCSTDPGDDRFRAYKDFERTGGVICRKCHDSKNSDGFSTVAWLLGCDFATALKKVHECTGGNTSAPAAKRPKPKQKAEKASDKPAKVKIDLIVADTNPELRRKRVAEWCDAKQGVSLQAVTASRHITGIYKGEPVIALAGYLGDASVLPTSVTMYQTSGAPFELRSGDAKNLNLEGSQDALIVAGDPASLAAATHVIKCEGPPDAFTAAAHLPPGWVAVTNACGAKAFRPEFGSVLAGKHVVVIHDADVPGQEGAQRWVTALRTVAASAVNVQLPYEISPDSGKDLRDWLNEGGRMADLIDAAEMLAAAEAKATQGGHLPAETGHLPRQVGHLQPQTGHLQPQTGHLPGKNGQPPEQDPFGYQKSMLADLGLDVLGQIDSLGQVLIYSRMVGRIERIGDITRLKRPVMKGLVQENQDKINDSDEAIPGTYKVAAIQDAISVLGAARKIRVDTVRGAGCWPSTDDRDVLLVGNAEALRYSDGRLSKIEGCRHGNELLGVGEFDPWYDPDRLAELVAGCDHQWATQTIDEATAYFGNWSWQREHDPMLITGCVLATWVQTLWRFRPHMAISGRTNSGKSSLFHALGMLFGELGHRSDKSTAAGIRQTVQQSARIVMLDEFEKSKHRAEILEMIRTGSRGGKIAMGTAHHKAIEYTVRHSIWISAIETGLKKSPDRNRFIAFELLKPPAERQGKLPTPDPEYLGDLGQRLLAIAIRNVVEARDLATKLRTHRIAGVDDRQVECFAVPAAILAVASGVRESAPRMMEQLFGNGIGEPEFMSDEMDLLHAILRCPVRCGIDSISIARLLRKAAKDWTPADDDAVQAMESAGVAFKRRGHKEGPPELFIDPKRMGVALGKTERDWIDTDIRQHLMRIESAHDSRGSIDGSSVRGVSILWDVILREMGDD